MERLAHVCLDVRNLEKSIRFYTAIGMKNAYDFKKGNKKRFGVYLKSGKGTFIEMFQLDKKGIT
ncbi:MAG: VOC family protein, partial [Candidatus Firestonebacteria bacterium]